MKRTNFAPMIPSGGAITCLVALVAFFSFEVGNPNGTSMNVELNVLGGIVGNELARSAVRR